jgi:hypothetical protein
MKILSKKAQFVYLNKSENTVKYPEMTFTKALNTSSRSESILEIAAGLTFGFSFPIELTFPDIFVNF